MNFDFICIGRVIARKSSINVVTIDEDRKEEAFDIVFSFRDGTIENAIKYYDKDDAASALKNINELLMDSY